MTVLVTLDTLLDGIKTTFSGITGVEAVQGYDELSEMIADHPLIQVWPGGGGMGDVSTNTAIQTSFNAGLRQVEHVIYADLYVTQRTFIGQDMAKLVTYIDRMVAKIDEQKSPAFGIAHCRLSHWNWSYFADEYASEVQIGARFELTVRIF